MRLIDADALKTTIVQNYHREFFGSVIWNILDDTPTIDVEPVKHGRWVPHADLATCSVCFGDCWADSAMEYNRCPNCGAKMDAKEE